MAGVSQLFLEVIALSLSISHNKHCIICITIIILCLSFLFLLS